MAREDRPGSAARGLTLRGRAFLAAGVTTLACGFGLVERDLARVGVLALVAPLLSLAYVARRRPDLDVHRSVSPPSVPVGQEATVSLRLRNRGPGTALLAVEERLDYALAARPRYALPPLLRGDVRDLAYRLRPEMRGLYHLGPLEVRVREPFGLAELTHESPGTLELLVTPRTVDLPEVGLAGGWHGAGGEQSRAFTAGDVADATIRDYRRGDDLRRVHWPTTARTGELMVRREELPLQSTATVVVDNRRGSHRGEGSESTLERVVEAAASACRHLVEHGYEVQLVTADSTTVPGAGREAPLWTLMRGLSVLPLSGREAWAGSGSLEDPGVLIACVALASPERHDWLGRLDLSGGRGMAVLVEPEQGADAWLERRGWDVVTWSAQESLTAAWQRMARSGASS